MNKKNIYFATILLLVFVFSGCSDFLEVEPKSSWKAESFYSSKEEAELALAGIYGTIANDDVYGWNFNVVIEAGTDETYTNTPNNTSWDPALYLHTPSNDKIGNVWLRFYTVIQFVNQFETNLDPNMFEQEEYNNLLARARFMRAFSYFTLANWFGPVPLRLTPSSSQEDNHVPPSPVFDVYSQAEKDYLFAAEHLLHSKSPDYVPGEPNKMAAHGLLARLYLKMGGFQPYLAANDADCYFENRQQYFEKAKQQCEIIINDGWHSIVPYSVDPESYRNHFLTYLQDRYDLKESLFEISFGNFQQMGLRVDGRLGNINGVSFTGTADIPRGFANVSAALPLYNAYSGEDARREWSLAGYRNQYSNSTQRYTMRYYLDKPLNQKYAIGKFRRWEPADMEALKAAGSMVDAPYTILNSTPGSDKDPNFTSINFPILRYSDVLLMHAEAIIGGRYGTNPANDAAVNSLNIVRERAGLEPYTGSLNHDDFFKEIVDERLRELCFEGLRKQDLIRWHMLEEKLQETDAAIKNNEAYSASDLYHQTYLSAGENFDRTKHLLLPYPLQETLINQQLDQRDGW
ncbi:RagB/SusD family nutrient uptake outer membrane protein [Sinomicrobium sp.]